MSQGGDVHLGQLLGYSRVRNHQLPQIRMAPGDGCDRPSYSRKSDVPDGSKFGQLHREFALIV